MTHVLKIRPEYFKEVLKGNKRAEVRKMDREYSVGDKLILQEFDSNTATYTGREIAANITHILTDTEFLRANYGVLSIKKVGTLTYKVQ